MTNRVWTDRSRYITAQRCLRQRWYEYHEGGMGIRSASTPLPLAVGGSVHAGLAFLLAYCSIAENWTPLAWRAAEDTAVTVALADFARYTPALELDSGEQAPLAEAAKAAEGDELLMGMVTANTAKLDKYLVAEQTALVEAMVRAYARRRLRPLLEQYEVLEVEREGIWQLHAPHGGAPGEEYWGHPNVWFMSRPDALLLDRTSRQLYLLSYKTTGKWDTRKARDIEHDMQGLSEGIEIERRLADWYEAIHRLEGYKDIKASEISPAMFKYLYELTAPPRILGIRYEFLLKGDRWTDKDLARELGLDVRHQRSHLIRGYLNAGMASGDEQWNWSWDYLKEGGESSKLYYKNWRSTPVWEHMTIAKWIDLLDQTAELVVADADASGFSVAQAGWSSPAQATGTTTSHPLDDAFVPPVMVYRNEDDLRDLVEQMEASEVRVAEGVAAVGAAPDDDARRSLLNIHFPMSRHSCEYPSSCPFTRVCFGGEEMRRDPMASGQFVPREVNHPQELGGE